MIHNNFKAYSVDKSGKESIVHLDHDNFYTGRVFGEEHSSVRAHIEDGILTASVVLPDETYHIEPSWRHLPDVTNKNMIAYRASDVKLSWNNEHNKHGEMGAPATCGYIKEGLELEENDDDDEVEEEEVNDKPETLWEDPNSDNQKDEKRIVKRQVDQYEYTPTKTRCPLLLVADYRFFQEMGGSNTKTTINYLVRRYLTIKTTISTYIYFILD